MKDTLELIYKVLLEMKEDIAELKIETHKNSIVLEDHTRRSLASEQRLEVQEEKLEKFMESVDTKLEPIKSHVLTVNAWIKILGIIFTALVSIGGLIYSFLSLD